MKYWIFEGNMERLNKKLAKIGNKCKRYGCGFHYQAIGAEKAKKIRATVKRYSEYKGTKQTELTRCSVIG